MGIDWRNIKTRSGYTQPGYCTYCEQAGVLRRRMASNNVWHIYLICPNCNARLSGSIAREELKKNGVVWESLPVQEDTQKWERVPPCLECGGYPIIAKTKRLQNYIPVWFCRACACVIADTSETQMKEFHRRLDDLEDIDVLLLRSLPYDEYLDHPWWKRVTWARKWLAGFKCELCGSTEQLNTHHNSYTRRGCERPEDLIVLCRRCHESYHDLLEKKDANAV